MRIRWRIRCGNHGDIFGVIRASHLTELNLCWSRPMLKYSYLSTINEASDVAPFNRSAYYYSSQVEVRELSEGHISWLWVRWCEKTRCSKMSACDRHCDMLIPARENLSNILTINFVRISVLFCAFSLLNNTSSWSYSVGWQARMNAKLQHITDSTGETCKGYVKVKPNSTLFYFTL
jgi:hypothetical protein